MGNTTVAEVAGNSMAPTLTVGTRVLVARAAVADLTPGDIVVLAGDPWPILHRVLHVVRSGGRTAVFHRGDAGGGIGVADGGALLGKVVAVLAPTPAPMAPLDALPPEVQRSFRRARRVAHLTALGVRLGLRRRFLPRWAQHAAALLLR